MAHLGTIFTVNGDADAEILDISLGPMPGYPCVVSIQDPSRTLLTVGPKSADRTTNVSKYPHSVKLTDSSSRVAGEPQLGRMKKSIRGYTQNSSSGGIPRRVAGVVLSSDGTFPAQVVGEVDSTNPLGYFDLRVPTDQRMAVVMKGNDDDIKNAVILKDILPVDPV